MNATTGVSAELAGKEPRQRASLLISSIVIAAGILAAVLLFEDRGDAALMCLLVTATAAPVAIRHNSSRLTFAKSGQMLDLVYDAIVVTNRSGVIREWNSGAEQTYGWSRQDALGRNCDQLLKTRIDTAQLSAALARDGQWTGELTRVSREGKTLVLASRRRRRLNALGFAAGFVEITRDLTAERSAQAAKEASERRFARLFHAAGVSVFETDWSAVHRRLYQNLPPGMSLREFLLQRPDVLREAMESAVTLDSNQAAAQLLEANGPDEVRSNSHRVVVPEYTIIQIFAALDEGRDGVEVEASMSTYAGHARDIVGRVALLPGGEPWSRLLVMSFDVTERNRMRVELENMSAQLAHAGRVALLGQLAASITHEVSQPLTAIASYGRAGMDRLERSTPEVDAAHHCVAQVVANAERANNVVARVRALARRAPLNPEPLSITEVIAETMSLVRSEARQSRVLVDLRPSAANPTVFADRVQIQQVLVNLLLNAIQAMRAVDGRAREVQISVETAPNAVWIRMRDSGSGIPQERAKRIFEPFFTTKPDGMGIGLSVCRSIVSAHGGEINAVNNEDFGATFSIRLPTNSADARVNREVPAL